MRVLIVGGGKLGYYLAKTLLEQGNIVTLIEKDRRECEYLANDLDIPVHCGDGTMLEVLSGAGAGKCDTFIAVTDRDELNLISCELAKKQFNVPKVVARSNNPKNIDIMKKLGVDYAVSPTKLIAQVIEHEIDGAQVRFISDISSSDVTISEYTIPKNWSRSGIMVKDLNLPDECVLVYGMRNKELMIIRGNTELMAGDDILALTVGGSSKLLKHIFEL